MRFNYEKLNINSSFIQGRGYLELRSNLILIDEFTGVSNEVGNLEVILLSTNWGEEPLTKIASGIDDSLYRSAKCLEAHGLLDGTIAFILTGEFGEQAREFEDRALIELTSCLRDVYQVETIITPLHFNRAVTKDLGYLWSWGPDKRKYWILSYTALQEPGVLVDIKIAEASTEGTQSNLAPIWNRLRSIEAAKSNPYLSKHARIIVELFNSIDNVALTKRDIVNQLHENEDVITLAMLELLEYQLIEELHEEDDSTQDNVEGIATSLIDAVQSRNHELAKEILLKQREHANQISSDGRSMLFIAIENKDLPMVELLLKSGADPDYESGEGMTSLKLCWLHKNRDAEKLLRSFGVSMEL